MTFENSLRGKFIWQSSPTASRRNSVADRNEFVVDRRNARGRNFFIAHIFNTHTHARTRTYTDVQRTSLNSTIDRERSHCIAESIRQRDYRRKRKVVYLRDAFLRPSNLSRFTGSQFPLAEAAVKKKRKKANHRADGTRKEGANRIVIKRGGRGGVSCWRAWDNGRLTEYDLCPNITGQR